MHRCAVTSRCFAGSREKAPELTALGLPRGRRPSCVHSVPDGPIRASRLSVRHKLIEYVLDSESDSGRRGNLTGDGLASLVSFGITFLMSMWTRAYFPCACASPQLAAARRSSPQLAAARRSSPQLARRCRLFDRALQRACAMWSADAGCACWLGVYVGRGWFAG